MTTPTSRTIAELIFVAFNKHVVALDRYTGEKVWTWEVPKGAGQVVLLLDGDRLIISASGYMYCLDPLFGQEVWNNPLEGMGIGIPCLASLHGTTAANSAAIAHIAAQQQAAAAVVVT